MDARDFLPRSADLDTLADAASRCQGCELHADATQTVFGSGPPHARVVFVGEQPGDVEDRRGEPFVGPAGQLLDRALHEIGIARADTYVTNAVKHFRFQQSGTRRLHQTPERQHITACRPWLSAELALLNPEVVVALGATAVLALLGPDHRVTRDRGRLLPFEVPTNAEETAATHTTHALITTHPSAILRTPPEQRDAAYEAFLSDLRTVAAVVS